MRRPYGLFDERDAMKKSPQLERLEQTLRSSRLSARGFMGDDPRSLTEILDADAAEVERLGYTMSEIAARMQQLTDLAKPALGDCVLVGEHLEICADDNRGLIPCPWPHGVRCQKTVTTVTRTDTSKSVQWSDLNIHLIAEHGFFQGRGSPFRLEPGKLVEIIFG